ncbi:GNAT family N-acetyltransferase [Legionella gresilensis]|uniref:GNAT family N-acetyltransferase n=1 Tax=Legionella gresilensis TaxID=91823 RepID=UPI001041B5AA|nr:GNAT family N-acetyltransferase [Legionella gresilensis]
MLITKELAHSIENCIKQSHINLTYHVPGSALLEVGSGAACFTGKTSFFSQVVGWGFQCKDQQFLTQIEAIENFYHTLGHLSIDIELSPLVGNDIIQKLSECGYFVTEVNNISLLNLASEKITSFSLSSDYQIRQVSECELHTWAHCVALGFGCKEAWQQFYHYARTANVAVFGAYFQDQLVAGGIIAIHQSICDLGLTSTLPAHRGQGLQKALLAYRLAFAQNMGAKIASVTTEPGSISDLNSQKMGFLIAYTRLKLTRLISE